MEHGSSSGLYPSKRQSNDEKCHTVRYSIKVSQILTDTDPEEAPNANNEVVIWAGVPATEEEVQAIRHLRDLSRSAVQSHIPAHRWYLKVKDTELLRFLRAHQGDIAAAWSMIEKHVAWRSSMYGADSPLTKHSFINSPLHHEVFWAGLNKDQCPTLVIRTQVHDGRYYDDDLQIYQSFIVSMIEKGRRLYGVGTHCQMCVLFDRGGKVTVNGQPKREKADMKIVPKLLDLVSNLRVTLQEISEFDENYPDIFHSAKIAPSSWFFTFCFRTISATLDAATASKFEIVSDRELQSKLHSFLDPNLLPAHLGGSSSTYQSAVSIDFMKE
eukprot:gene11514-13383_t